MSNRKCVSILVCVWVLKDRQLIYTSIQFFSVFHFISNKNEIRFGICIYSSNGMVSSSHVANMFQTYDLCRYPELILYIMFLA